ncbi:asparaginase-domain-containing protein [Suillus clintonianus]|uniref:asparaginase-domain-containing protein n=1 Tax=Suillus clintonianus TaxID=1904413 RepID=UPI001B87EC79|nr:asparaginase-domain-containing protein [Suillus clintonianus]KAG2139034.1 asparaginase-domain-containing protein [Suillus clintonianus]
MEPRSDEARVLVIYTGGTIGMLVSSRGYVPEPYFLTDTIRSQKRFHDPLQDSLFSNAASVEGYREWSNSGKSTPSGSDNVPTPGASTGSQPTLLVRSSRPIGSTSALLPSIFSQIQKVIGQPECRKVSDGVYETRLPSLVTPRCVIPGHVQTKRIRYAILEWNPLLDSSNMEMDDWIRIAAEIELNYTSFDAFVVLHGTDTMSYTSSALSFLLEDLGKTVILTGAQIPLSQLRNDAVDNLLGALSIAGNYTIPECSLYFNHTLYRGNRVSKASSYDLNAFHSPNFPPLVNVGIDIVVNWNDVLRQTSLRRFRAYKGSPHVATLRLFPGMTGATARAFLAPPTRGIVLETFGAGNASQRPDLLAAFKNACDRGVVIVAISQCVKGSVSGDYETGQTLIQAGVVLGGDMTPECALTKLSYLLAKPEFTAAEVRSLISLPLRGELTPPVSSLPAAPSSDDVNTDLSGLLSEFVRLSSSARKADIPQIVIGEEVQDAAAPWTRTAAERASTEAALLPFLVHLAVARDDVEGLEFCLASAGTSSGSGVTEGTTEVVVPGGIVNCLDAGSGRSPLHVAALNGNMRCVEKLLESGALVHLRDGLGHTALYYAARQGHAGIVDTLMSAGANLGGTETEAGYVGLALRNAVHAGNGAAVEIWRRAGVKHAD